MLIRTSPEHCSELALIEASQLQREAMKPPRIFANPHHETMQTTTRRFHILWMLDDRKPLRSEDLAAHFGVSQRAIYRDMAYLRPITDAFAGIGGGYLRKR